MQICVNQGWSEHDICCSCHLSGDLLVGESIFTCWNVGVDTGSMSPLSCLCLHDSASLDSTEASVLIDFLCLHSSMVMQVSSATWASHLIVKDIFSHSILSRVLHYRVSHLI